MRNKEIKKTIRTIATVTLCAALIPQTTFAATENDLREVMGIGKINDESLQNKTNELTDRLLREENYNELAAMLKESGVSLKVTEKEVSAEKEAYAKMMDDFSAGESASTVIEQFSIYDSYTYYTDPTSVGSFDTEFIDTTGTKEKLSKLSNLKKIMENDTNIGSVGSSMQKITKDMSMIQLADEKTLELITEKKEIVKAAFSGKVTEVGKKFITIKSGQTIYVTYSGIKTKLKKKGTVKQGDVIGRATGSSIKVTFSMNGVKRNILLAYGNTGSDMYAIYLSENPWDKQILDFSNVKDKSTKEKANSSNSGMYVITDGEKSEVTYEGPDKASIESTEILEDPFSPDNKNKV